MKTNASPAMVLSAIRSLMLAHGQGPGTRLPSERALAKRLGTSLRQVRTALQGLQDEGVIVATSSRIRQVSPDAHRATAALADAVLILSPVQLAALAGARLPQQHSEAEFLGIVAAAERAGRSILAMHPRQVTPVQLLALLRTGPFGTILTEAALATEGIDALLAVLAEHGGPVAVHADVLPQAQLAALPFDSVHLDHRAATAALCRNLAARGCRSLWCLWERPDLQRDPHWLAERTAGYQEACRELGLAAHAPIPTEPVVGWGPDYPAERFAQERRLAFGVLHDFLQPQQTPGPVGLLLMTDALTCPVAAAMRDMGWTPGGDLLLAGFDNKWPTDPRRAFDPARPCLSVDHDDEAIGAALVQVLLDRRSGRLPQAAQRRVLQARIVEPQTHNA